MTTEITPASRRRSLRAAVLAAQQAQLEAEQAAHEQRIEVAVQEAARARCAAVEDLYELLGVEPVTRTRKRGGRLREVNDDPGEVKRARALVDAVVELLGRVQDLPVVADAPVAAPAQEADRVG